MLFYSLLLFGRVVFASLLGQDCLVKKRKVMAESKKLARKGQVIHSKSREIIHNVAQFMRQEAEAREPIIPLRHTIERILAATKISKSSYLRIEKQARNIEAGEGNSSATSNKRKRLCLSMKWSKYADLCITFI